MKQDIDTYALLHTAIMEKLITNFQAIGNQVFEERGMISMLSGSELLAALSVNDALSPKEREFCARSAVVGERLLEGIKTFGPEEVAVMNQLEGNLRQAESVEDIRKVVGAFRQSTDRNAVLSTGFLLAEAILEKGADTIYNEDWVREQLEKQSDDQPTANGLKDFLWGAAGVAVEDVAGAVVGGAAGATGAGLTTWWTGPGTTVTVSGGAVAGGGSGAVMFSGKAIWDNLKAWWKGPVIIHGPNDPNGPIGPHRPDDIPRN